MYLVIAKPQSGEFHASSWRKSYLWLDDSILKFCIIFFASLQFWLIQYFEGFRSVIFTYKERHFL